MNLNMNLKFSIKHILIGMAVLGVLSLFMSSAARGNRMAFGLSVAIAGSFIPFIAYAVVHWLSFAIAQIPIPGFQHRRFSSANAVVPNSVGVSPLTEGPEVSQIHHSQANGTSGSSASDSIPSVEVQPPSPPDNQAGTINEVNDE